MPLDPPSASIPLPPTARNRSRWWRRPGSPASRTSAHPETSDAGCHRCATACRAEAAAHAAGDALLACALASPVRHLATPASPRCNSARCGARAATSCGNAARSDRNSDRGRAPALAPPAPPAPVGRGPALPPVEQTVIAKLLVTLSPAPHLPITNADDLGCLPPPDPFRHGSQNHFLYFHRPLHRGLRVREHAPHVLLLSPPEKRTDHVLS